MSKIMRQQRRKASRAVLKQQRASQQKMETVIPMTLERIAFELGLTESEVTQGIRELNAKNATRLRIEGGIVKGRI